MPKEFDIPAPEWPDEKKVGDALEACLKVGDPAKPREAETSFVLPHKFVKALAAVATSAWRAKTRTVDPVSGEVREEMKRVHRHIANVLETLDEIGVQVKDHTGDSFDYGLPVTVVTTQPTPGLARESVIETIKPTIFLQGQIIQNGEVVIAVPAQ